MRAWHVARRMARFVLSNLGRASERGRGGDLFSFGNIQRGKASQAITDRQGLTARLSPPTHARARGGRAERAAARLGGRPRHPPPAGRSPLEPRLSLLYQPPARTTVCQQCHLRPPGNLILPTSSSRARRRLFATSSTISRPPRSKGASAQALTAPLIRTLLPPLVSQQSARGTHLHRFGE